MKDKLPQNFCILPWTAMEVQPNGTVKPCCMYKDTLKDPNGQEYLIQKNTMEEITESDELKEIKQLSNDQQNLFLFVKYQNLRMK